MLGSRLAGLDIPTDGSVKLVSIKTAEVDGCTEWTVVFRQKPGTPTCATPVTASSPRPDAALAPVTAVLPEPDSGLTFAPITPFKPPPSSTLPADYSMRMDRIFPLKCSVKTYAWGKLGADSLVGQLAADGSDEGLELNTGTPYAELWMGTHPSGPSMVMLTSPWRTVTPLSEWIKLNPSLLGPRARTSTDSPMALQRRRSMVRDLPSRLSFRRILLLQAPQLACKLPGSPL